jgi:uncharacterized protein (UPF0332 family)
MKDEFEQCIHNGVITKITMNPDRISNELNEAQYDLDTAEKSAATEDFKWAIIQGHFSIAHSFRALLFSKGYNDKNQNDLCLKHAIEALFVDNGMLDEHFILDFEYSTAVWNKEAHGYTDKEDFAFHIINSAGEVCEAAKEIIGYTE